MRSFFCSRWSLRLTLCGLLCMMAVVAATMRISSFAHAHSSADSGCVAHEYDETFTGSDTVGDFVASKSCGRITISLASLTSEKPTYSYQVYANLCYGGGGSFACVDNYKKAVLVGQSITLAGRVKPGTNFMIQFSSDVTGAPIHITGTLTY